MPKSFIEQMIGPAEMDNHWEKIYSSKPPGTLSWYQEDPACSLRLILEHAGAGSCRIIDAGGGASTLHESLVKHGFGNVTVADISPSALEISKARLGDSAGDIRWIAGNILEIGLDRHSFDIWHDRAVFHFLGSEEERLAYAEKVLHALRPGGIFIVAVFAEDGPERCSGLPVVRYTPHTLAETLGSRFSPIGHEDDFHRTPGGAMQHFICCTFMAEGEAGKY